MVDLLLLLVIFIGEKRFDSVLSVKDINNGKNNTEATAFIISFFIKQYSLKNLVNWLWWNDDKSVSSKTKGKCMRQIGVFKGLVKTI